MTSVRERQKLHNLHFYVESKYKAKQAHRERSTGDCQSWAWGSEGEGGEMGEGSQKVKAFHYEINGPMMYSKLATVSNTVSHN